MRSSELKTQRQGNLAWFHDVHGQCAVAGVAVLTYLGVGPVIQRQYRTDPVIHRAGQDIRLIPRVGGVCMEFQANRLPNGISCASRL
jgi:hypothetical protein